MDQKPTAAFLLTLLAGLWMLGIGGMMYRMGPEFMGYGGSWMWGRGMMHGMMPMSGLFYWIPLFGTIGGVILMMGATFLYRNPEQCHRWGLVIICVSALNLFIGMGGFLAAALGIVGGALAMSWKIGDT